MKFKHIIIVLSLLLFTGCSDLAINTNPIEEDTNALIVIDSIHERIHSGEGFQFSLRQTNIPASTVSYLLMNTTLSATHFRDYSIRCDSNPILVELYEEPTITSYGNLTSSKNRNRFSNHTSDSLIYLNSTISNDGTLLFVDEIYSNNNKAGEISGVPVEWLLKKDSTYLIKITNNNGNNVNCVYNFFWYDLEHN